MLRKYKLAQLTTSAAATLAVAAAATSVEAASFGAYNLVVFGDLTSNSEVEGNSFIGGNLYGTSSNYCTHCTPESTFHPFDNVGLKVVGNVYGDAKQIDNGTDLVYGGDLSAPINLNGGGSQSFDGDLGSEFESLKNYLLETSSYLAELDSNSSVEVPGEQPGAVRFNASGDEFAVFDIDAAELFSGKTQQIELNLNGSEVAIINVSGESANWTTGNMVGALTSDAVRQKVIWNFYEATDLNLKNAVQGSLLAPLAALTNYTPIEGTVVVESFDQYGEVHWPSFAGELPEHPPEETPEHPPESVPEPSALLGMAAVLGLGSTLRRKLK